METETVWVQIIPKFGYFENFLHNEVWLHKPIKEKTGAHWDKLGSVPFKWVGELSNEEVGQEMGGN